MSEILREIFTGLWFFIPVGLANTIPPVAARVPGLKKLDYPLDFGIILGGKRLFGAHKTFRGLVAGILLAILVVLVQKHLYGSIEFFSINIELDYNELNPILLGTLSALGALLGDAIKSFFKRRVGIESGGKWVPFDQIDFIIGGILFTLPMVQLSITAYFSILVIYLVLHRISSIAGYMLGLKDVPY